MSRAHKSYRRWSEHRWGHNFSAPLRDFSAPLRAARHPGVRGYRRSLIVGYVARLVMLGKGLGV
jgi:hypothetical protein